MGWIVRPSLALQGGKKAMVTAASPGRSIIPLWTRPSSLSGPDHRHWTFRRRYEKGLLPHHTLHNPRKQPTATLTWLDATSLPSEGSPRWHPKVAEQGWSRAGCGAASLPQSHPPLRLATLVFALQIRTIHLSVSYYSFS